MMCERGMKGRRSPPLCFQDCGLPVQPAQPCGLQPFQPQRAGRTCSSGHVPGRESLSCPGLLV